MSEIVKKPIGITETILRDAHQSLIATRMPTSLMTPILDKMDKVGYHSVECWGGATFDSCIHFSSYLSLLSFIFEVITFLTKVLFCNFFLACKS